MNDGSLLKMEARLALAHLDTDIHSQNGEENEEYDKHEHDPVDHAQTRILLEPGQFYGLFFLRCE